MFSGYRKTTNRNRSTSYFNKRDSSNSRTFSRIKAAQEKNRMQLKISPLYVSATSWIVVTPNAFSSTCSNIKVNLKSSEATSNSKPASRLGKFTFNSNLLGVDNEVVMHGHNWDKRREIASLTKIMTWYATLKLMERYDLHKHNTLVTVSRRASQQVGTTAYLQEDHTFSIWDLLHGLMLPSGNDAAIALAEFFGSLLLEKDRNADEVSIFTNSAIVWATTNSREISEAKKLNLSKIDTSILTMYKWESDKPEFKSSDKLPELKCSRKEKSFCDYSFSDFTSNNSDPIEKRGSLSFTSDRQAWSKSFYSGLPLLSKKSEFGDSPEISRFIIEMNSFARKLKMKNTHFDSPHGLSNPNNYSSAYDIALLSSICTNNLEFNRIVRTKNYTCKSRNKLLLNLSKVVQKDYSWTNTNKLLGKGFVGIKTGITRPAGPCLATHLKSKKRSYIVVLLNSWSIEQRWIDTWKIIEYCQLKIRCGLIKDIKPPKMTPVKGGNNHDHSMDIDNIEIKVSHAQSSQESDMKNQSKISFYKTGDDNLDGSEEDGGSTTMSSSSPITTHRKSLF